MAGQTEIFELATRLTATGLEQTKAAISQVETSGTSAASSISRAWAQSSQQTQTASAATTARIEGFFANTRKQVAATIARVRDFQSALDRTARSGGAVSEIFTASTRARTTAAFDAVSRSAKTAAANTAAFAPTLERLRTVMFSAAAAGVGLEGGLGKVAGQLLLLSGGGLLVAGATAAFAALGAVWTHFREKAEEETNRITATVQEWQRRMDEATGAARRKGIQDLADNLDQMRTALEKLQRTVTTVEGGRGSAGHAVTRMIGSPEEIAEAKRQVDNAERLLRLAQGSQDSGPQSRGAFDERVQGMVRLAAAETTRAEGVRQLKAEEASLTAQVAAASGPLAARAALTERLTAVQNALRDVEDKQRAAYERRLQVLGQGAAIESTRGDALAALQVEEARLTSQLERGNLPLEERIRLEGLLHTVQVARGSLPETEEDRTRQLEAYRAAFASYLSLLQTAAGFESTRVQAVTELSAAEARTRAALRATNLTLEDRLRLEQQLAGIKAGLATAKQGESDQRSQALARQTSAQIAALQTAIQTDIPLLQATSEQMMADLANGITTAAIDAWGEVLDVFAEAPLELGTTLFDALATGIGQANAKASDLALQGLGSIFAQMGSALIKYGLAMTKLLPALANPFTSGPAALVAGSLLLVLGKTLGGLASGSGGSGGGGGSAGPSFDNYRAQQDNVVRIVVNSPAGEAKVGDLKPVAPVNVTIIGPGDPVAVRGIATMVKSAQNRGLL